MFTLGSGVLVSAPPANATTNATSMCYGVYNYSGFETTYFNNEGIEGDLLANNSDSNMQVYDYLIDHAAMWLGDKSRYDDNDFGYDWNQVGYAVGDLDGQKTNNVEVYDELAGPNTKTYPNATITWYPDLALGNHYFTDSYTGEKGDGGRGLYEGTYSLDYKNLGTSWMVDPSYTQQESNDEGGLQAESGWCPQFGEMLFGTNGDVFDIQWTASTEMLIYDNTYNGDWEAWTPSAIATSNITNDPPYGVLVLSQDDAWDSYGGGP
ncbi:MAG: hypothetical protein ACRDZR_10530 [Acidimicrobiales bacterium]